MNLRSYRLAVAVTVAGAALLAGCASNKGAPNTIYDFGAPSAQRFTPANPSSQLPPIVVMDATGGAVLDNERMVYRLNYADPLQARTYAGSRWSGTPLALVTQRLKVRLAQAGVTVLSATDAANRVPILRIEIDDFVHAFSSTSASEGQIQLRASVLADHRLVAQQSFAHSAPAPSQDAAGGVAALAAGTDRIALDLKKWLSTLDLQGK
ncbi:ABC-type transport auxiliary lipoprotein family protein [Massilia sp. MP_M2]|uniref:ABC-type transport auxiliary lipoprotein family protein n=1 Tax=Massilia sp. MP_M2 TaxID=3071713 RepID=UPI00319D89CD